MVPWQDIFKEYAAPQTPADLADLKRFLDRAHVSRCLVKPFQEIPDYPVVEPRELLPSFETDMYEYKN